MDYGVTTCWRMKTFQFTGWISILRHTLVGISMSVFSLSLVSELLWYDLIPARGFNSNHCQTVHNTGCLCPGLLAMGEGSLSTISSSTDRAGCLCHSHPHHLLTQVNNIHHNGAWLQLLRIIGLVRRCWSGEHYRGMSHKDQKREKVSLQMISRLITDLKIFHYTSKRGRNYDALLGNCSV